MDLKIKPDIFSHVSEIWEVSSHAVEVWTKDWNHYRITAHQRIRGGGNALYMARYEENVSAKLGLEKRPSDSENIWVGADMPDADGDTIEECLHSAIGWVEERASKRTQS